MSGVADIVGMTDGEPNAGHEISGFRQVLGAVLATLTVRDRMSCIDSVLVLDLAFEQLLLHLSATDMARHGTAGLDEVERAIERLEVPVTKYLAGHSRADRARQLDELVRRASECRRVIEQIAAVVDSEREPATVVGEWESRCARRTLLAAADEIDAKLKKIDAELGAVRTDKESRVSAFNEDRAHYEEALDEKLQEGQNRIDATIQLAKQRSDEAEEKIDRLHERLHEEVGSLLSGAVVKRISARYETAENRERRSAVRWRVFAVVAASLGVAQLALAWFVSEVNPVWTSVLSHVSVTAAFGGIAAYAARQAAQHLREQRALSSDQLRMVASIIWMDRMTPEAREEMQKELAGTFFRAAEHHKDDRSPEALSMLPIDKFAQIATNASKTTAEDAPSNEGIP